MTTIYDKTVLDFAQQHDLSLTEAAHAVAQLNSTEPGTTPQGGPPKAPRVSLPSNVLAIRALVREQAISEAEAQKAVLYSDIEGMRPAIERQLQHEQDQADAKAAVVWYDTEEGRAHLAQQFEAQRAADKAKADTGRSWMRSQGFDPDGMTDAEVLAEFTRDNTDKHLANDPAANAKFLADQEAAREAGESS